MIVALILLVPACLFAEFGFGLWNLRNWARIATIVLPCWARSAPRWDFDARLCTSGLGSASQFNSTQHRCGCAVVSRPAQRKEILRARLGRLACRLPKKCRRDRREILRSLRRKCCAQRILEGRSADHDASRDLDSTDGDDGLRICQARFDHAGRVGPE